MENENCNCIQCKYINIENEEYSKFIEGYVRFECKLKGHTDWFDTESNDTTKFICNEFIKKEGI